MLYVNLQLINFNSMRCWINGCQDTSLNYALAAARPTIIIDNTHPQMLLSLFGYCCYFSISTVSGVVQSVWHSVVCLVGFIVHSGLLPHDAVVEIKFWFSNFIRALTWLPTRSLHASYNMHNTSLSSIYLVNAWQYRFCLLPYRICIERNFSFYRTQSYYYGHVRRDFDDGTACARTRLMLVFM